MSANFSFLVTTDNHLGFKHDDPLRRRDSFMAFAETLQIARDKDVDFVLLGGDLFHMNRPNTWLEHKCIKILRRHMNAPSTRGTTFKRTSGEFSHFPRVKHGNFEDPSLQVPYPIFTIHGNHDDPTGTSGKSVCEKLATCGLLNYFGKLKLGEKNYVIEPIVLEKGAIKIALYGIGFIPDKKLCAAFKSGNVIFKRSADGDVFNVLVVHQNRVKHCEDKCIPDSFFPNWFHLIIRGHEHDAQRPTVIPESKVDGLVYQPGSTVATSIEPRESCVKQCGLMTVSLDESGGDGKKKYELDYNIINLRCYRKILFKDIYQKEVFEYIKKSNDRRKLEPIEYRNIFRKFVIDKIETLLEDYQCGLSQEDQHTQDSSISSEADVNVTSVSQKSSQSTSDGVYSKLSRFDLPLVRIRIEYVKTAELFDASEVNAMFYPNQTANRDIIRFKPQKLIELPDGTKQNATFMQENDDDLDQIDEEGLGDFGETIDLDEERKESIESMILNYFNDKPLEARLKAISLKEYTDAVSSATQEKNIISAVLKKKRAAMGIKFDAIIKRGDEAKLNYNSEVKISNWFLAAFKGAEGKMKSTLAAPLEDWDHDEMDDDDEVMCID